MNMKRILTLLIVALSFSAFSQTNPPPNSTGSFYQSALSYFTSFNPALDGTFQSKGSFWTSLDSLQGGPVPLANSLGLSYDVWNHVAVESVTRNGGVAGTIISQQVGIGYNIVVHDARLTPYADAGYQFGAAKGAYAEIGVRVTKALSEHTYAGVGIGAQFPANRQVFSAIVGFTF